MGDVAVYVVLGGGPVRGGAPDSKRSCLTGGAGPLSCGKRSEGKDRCGPQRGSGPVGTRWASRSCPASPGSSGITCTRCSLSNSTWETTSPITALNQADDVHPTGDGYRVVVETVYPYVTAAIQEHTKAKRTGG